VTKKLQPLGAAQKATLAKSSPPAIEKGLAGLRRYLRRDRWISLDNRYRRNSLDAIKADVKANSIHDKNLLQYIAASATLHCSDGWSFLGRALHSLARGDVTTALHLGYYAELRAANSILATQGTGVFDDPSFSVNSHGTCHRISGYHTHTLAWLALEHWADGVSAAVLLGDIISVENVSHRAWLDSFQKSSVINRRRIASKWLKTWGLDLQRFVSDREARNEASYRPSTITPVAKAPVQESIEFLRELWRLHEPSGFARFDIMDKYLLRLSLEQTYSIVKGRSAKSDPRGFKTDIESMISLINPGSRAAAEWVDFFARNSEPADPVVIRLAMTPGTAENPRSHMQVISRAVVLLRVATGACSLLLDSAKFGKPELGFWWRGLGEDRGLWTTGGVPDNLTDLWADVATAIDQVDGWFETNKGTASYSSWQGECASGISVLGTCERIGLWGLGL
jgi:hypothetical protein